MYPKKIVLIGSSAGGPRIIREIFSSFPFLDGSIIIVQHMPSFVNQSFCDEINSITDMTVTVAENGDLIKNGNIYIAPSEVHLELINNHKIKLYKGEKIHFVCPSVDVTMKSIIKKIGVKIIGVILTGMGSDGSEGIIHINHIDGTTIAQDEKSSIIFGMPKAAIKTGYIDYILNPYQIRNKLIKFMNDEIE